MVAKFRTPSLFFTRSRFLFLLALVSLFLALPIAVQAQSADPLQVFNNYYLAARVGNLEGMMGQYADNAVFKYLPSAPFPGPSTYNGLTEIRGVEKGALDAHLVPDCATPVVQSANVSSNCTVNNPNLPFQIAFKETLNVQNGKIASTTVEFTPDTYAKLKALTSQQGQVQGQGGAPGAPNTGQGGAVGTAATSQSENLVWLVPLSGVVVLAALGLLVVARLRGRRPR